MVRATLGTTAIAALFPVLAGVPMQIGSAELHQPSTLIVTVIDGDAGFPLTNADVTELSTGQHRFSDEHGQVRLTWPGSGELRLRVREIGYQPVERTLERALASDFAPIFALRKVAYVISSVSDTSHCPTSHDSAALALSVSVLEQLKEGAEKYDRFRRLYPFETTVERRTAAVPPNGVIARIIASTETFRSDNWEAHYRPGDILEYDRGYFVAPLLLLPTLADSTFWEHHCFVARGLESYHDTRVIRLEFTPTADVKGPDWQGDALIDSSTSTLLRVDFKLAHPKGRFAPKRLEGYTTFVSPSPYVIVPDTTAAMWWTRDPDDPKLWGQPEFIQMIYTLETKYRKGKPPETRPVNR
jgi:hypothetical protein